MGHANKRKIARRKEPRPACKVLAKASPDASARWSNLPEGPLLRMFEVMVGQDDGRSRVSGPSMAFACLSASLASLLKNGLFQVSTTLLTWQQCSWSGQGSPTGLSSLEIISTGGCLGGHSHVKTLPVRIGDKLYFGCLAD